MADAGFFKGTSADQDRRFSDKEVKLLKSMKFPPEFDKKVDMRKVNLMVIRPWVAKKVVELVGFDDEVVVEYAMGLLEDKDQPTPDPKKMQINLTGFLTNSTPAFMSALWALLLEAQNSQAGIPQALIDEKKEEMRRARAGDTRALDERDRRARLDDFRPNDRGGFRGGGRGRGRGRGRGGYEDDRGGRGRDSGWGGRGGGPGRSNRRFSRSPPPRRRSPSVGSRSPPRRYRSPGYTRSSRSPPPNRRRPRSPSRSMSRSRSPPPPPRRRRRSPSYSPRDRRYRAGGGSRDSRSPPPRKRRISPGPGSAPSRSPSRSRSPPPRNAGRRRSASPPRKRASRRSPSRSRSRSMSRSRSPPPRRRSLSRDRGGKNRHYSPSRSRSSSRSRRGDTMDIDDDAKGGFKIKGQAEVEKRKSKWEDEASKDGPGNSDLEKRENELKERALRNKVVKTRKGSSGA